ncbi:unnamed protein product [Ambrosiozyma monospora]|uniref:Unnamed protein product n=1 Tax=Ambrosiozyma monospora TaxID=43982 RepID=A0ACB5SQN8_AMBMO|nr:unnamed protein product [Ambrosiozyma monospora]
MMTQTPPKTTPSEEDLQQRGRPREQQQPQQLQQRKLRKTKGKRIWEATFEGIRILLASLYLIYVVLTIPLSFEIGGLNCGLSYSITILLVYFITMTFRILRYHKFISTFLFYLQHLLLPSLLSIFLTIFTDPSFTILQDHHDNWFKSFWWNYVIEYWKLFLINSTPLFTILEGFCSLLSIQAIGQISQYLIKHKSDTWSIINLITSSFILAACCYFFVKIYVAPIDLNQIGLITSSLLGSAFTCTILITIFGIYTGRASSTLECSLMVAYILKCCYELFPELSEQNMQYLMKFMVDEFKKLDSQATTMNNRELLINIQNTLGYLNFNKSFSDDTIDRASQLYLSFKDFFLNVLVKFFVENFSKSFESLWDFLKISISNLTFSIIIQLAYRISVFFAATKIIPILNPVKETSRASMRFIKLIYLYSPCIIITVYTNLMIQYNDELDDQNQFWNWLVMKMSKSATETNGVHPWQFWNWTNIFSVLLLYFLELTSHDPDDSSLTDHWS